MVQMGAMGLMGLMGRISLMSHIGPIREFADARPFYGWR